MFFDFSFFKVRFLLAKNRPFRGRKNRIIFSNFYIFVLLYLNFLNGDIGIWREKRTGLRKY